MRLCGGVSVRVVIGFLEKTKGCLDLESFKAVCAQHAWMGGFKTALRTTIFCPIFVELDSEDMQHVMAHKLDQL